MMSYSTFFSLLWSVVEEKAKRGPYMILTITSPRLNKTKQRFKERKTFAFLREIAVYSDTIQVC